MDKNEVLPEYAENEDAIKKDKDDEKRDKRGYKIGKRAETAIMNAKKATEGKIKKAQLNKLNKLEIKAVSSDSDDDSDLDDEEINNIYNELKNKKKKVVKEPDYTPRIKRLEDVVTQMITLQKKQIKRPKHKVNLIPDIPVSVKEPVKEPEKIINRQEELIKLLSGKVLL